MHQSDSERLYYLDALRASLMLLGVVIHSAMVYQTDARWIVADADGSRTFDYLILIIHTFRMPAFFFISGFLIALVLTRKAAGDLMKVRIRRLTVPMIAAALVFNIPEMSILSWLGPEFGNAHLRPPTCTSLASIYHGCWVSHLWFLAVLFYFLFVAVALDRITKRLGRSGFRIPGPSSPHWVLSVIAFTALALAIVGLSNRSGAHDILTFLPFFIPSAFFRYLPFFLAGFLVQRALQGLHGWGSFSPISWLLLGVFWVLIIVRFSNGGLTIKETLYFSQFGTILYYATAIQTTALLIYLAAHLPAPTPKLSSYLADMSYSVYLVHHLVVIVLAIWLSNLELHLATKFILLTTLAISSSLLFHHMIVMRSRVAGFLFNGR